MTAPLTKGEAALQVARHDAHTEIMARPGKDLGDLTEEQFEAGLKKLKVVQDRIKRIIGTALLPGVHYGNPEFNGRKAFNKDILFKSGAQELRRLMRFTVRPVADPIIHTDAEWVSVVVQLGIFDELGRLIAQCMSACNTKESRFYSRKTGKPLYDDPREKLHDCIAMAEKRAASALSLEASGATGFFADAGLLAEAIEAGEAIAGASAEDKARIKQAAVAKGMSKDQFFGIIVGATGRPMVDGQAEPFVAADEVSMVLAAITEWERPTPVKAERVSSEARQPFPDAEEDFPA